MNMRWIGIFITIIGIIIIPLYLYFVNKAELKYTISSAMTIETSKGEQNWQLITISNTGNKEANRIKIKIDTKVLEYKIIPFLQTDEYQGNLSSKTLDIEYSSLPPQGIIEIRLSVPANENVINSIVNIGHDSGVATQATTKGRILSYTLLVLWIIISLAFIGIPILMGIFYDQYRLKANAHSPYRALGILQKKKPFFISQKIWEEIRENAVENAFKEDPYSQEQYRAFLNEDKPDYLNHDEYEQLVASVSEKYANTFWDRWIDFDADASERIISKFKTKHPKNLTIKSERDIEKEAITIFKMDFYQIPWRVYEPEKIETKYNRLAQSKLPDNVKKACLDILKDYYQYSLVRKIIDLGYIEDVYKIYDSNILTDTFKLENFAYKINMVSASNLTQDDNIKKLVKASKPNWMKDHDYKKLKCIAEKILSLDELLKKANAKELKASKDISEAKQTIKEFERKVKIINSELQIIDNLLKDPHSISKVEEHSNPFAKGNFENLIKISETLLKSKLKT